MFFFLFGYVENHASFLVGNLRLMVQGREFPILLAAGILGLGQVCYGPVLLREVFDLLLPLFLSLSRSRLKPGVLRMRVSRQAPTL